MKTKENYLKPVSTESAIWYETLVCVSASCGIEDVNEDDVQW